MGSLLDVAAAVLRDLEAAGLRIDAIDSVLRVEPRERITDALRTTIRANKLALIERIEQRDEIARHVAVLLHDAPHEIPEAMEVAMRDPRTALECFRSMRTLACAMRRAEPMPGVRDRGRSLAELVAL